MDLLRVLSIQLGFFPSLRLVEATRPEKFKKKCLLNGFGCLTLGLDYNTSPVAEAGLISSTLPAASLACHLAAV